MSITQTDKRYQILRNSKNDQRIWGDNFGNIYLADHSGDHDGLVGRPFETEDGPLRVIGSELRLCGKPSTVGSGAIVFQAPVFCERTQKRSQVGFTMEVASWLAKYYQAPITLMIDGVEFELKKIKAST